MSKPMDTPVKNYEISYLFSADIPEDAVFGEAGKITGFIQDAQGMVGRIEEPRKRKLAYPIRKQGYAYFGCTVFAAAPDKLPAITERMKHEKSIMRYFITEEVKRPTMEFRPRGERFRHAPSLAGGESLRGFTPQAPKEEDAAKFVELDKKLDEILGGDGTAPAAPVSPAAHEAPAEPQQ